MASVNKKRRGSKPTTHEGGAAARITAEQALRRSVMSCLLWERTFYEEGEEIADRIKSLAMQVPAATLAKIAIEARHTAKLRHVPLLLLERLTVTGAGSREGIGTSLVSDTIAQVITRADEMTEFLALYFNGKRKPLSAQTKKGLARAFAKFDAYQLTKYNRDGAVKLRDVAFLSHAVPSSPEQGKLIANMVNRTFFPEKTKSSEFAVKESYGLDGTPHVEPPDTWEVALSSGADKKATWERLIRERKLGYLALLRNLRNMEKVGVDESLVREAIEARRGAGYVLPFRYVAAARAAPKMEPSIDKALLACLGELPKLSGKTVVMVDVSGSMDSKLSGKSDLRCIDAAAALASIIQGEEVEVFVFDHATQMVPYRLGMAGVDNICKHLGGGTDIDGAVKEANTRNAKRIIVITDEQSFNRVRAPAAEFGYMINVGSYKNGVGYGAWVHIDGFSENVIRFIHEYERSTAV